MAAGEAMIAGVAGRVFRISFSGELAYEVAVPADRALTVWEAILAAGAPFGIRPYGLDALNLLRIEKGHVAGSEINGQTTARDLGLGGMLKKEGDFVGRALAGRPGLVDPKRLASSACASSIPRRARAGAHLVATRRHAPARAMSRRPARGARARASSGWRSCRPGRPVSARGCMPPTQCEASIATSRSCRRISSIRGMSG